MADNTHVSNIKTTTKRLHVLSHSYYIEKFGMGSGHLDDT